jgi:hypothetical protein
MAKRVYKQIELTTEQKLVRAEANLFNVRQRLIAAEADLASAQERGITEEAGSGLVRNASISEIIAEVERWRNEVAINEAAIAALRA